MALFRITYVNPETEVEETVTAEFHDATDATGTTTAREWAEDYGYTLADKGRYEVKEVTR